MTPGGLVFWSVAVAYVINDCHSWLIRVTLPLDSNVLDLRITVGRGYFLCRKERLIWSSDPTHMMSRNAQFFAVGES